MYCVLTRNIAQHLLKNQLIIGIRYHNHKEISHSSIMRSLMNALHHNCKHLRLRCYSTEVKATTASLANEYNPTKDHKQEYDEELEEEENDKPVVYTTSRAFKHKAYQNWRDSEIEVAEQLPYEWPIILTSLVIFMSYFCIFREENDIDEILGQTLFQTEPRLELQMIKNEIERHKKLGLDTTTLQAKLDQLEELMRNRDKPDNKN